ncbi:Tudor/PWWP/MBT superfamily protein [Striga hermonthica]|uniref:Tudor/PWWP/MBT superfamily protein n=1 Tax=Striga hermonthica TaxID=68872 RepID=A0A9N7MWI8_STRHE|nr:Tudor/PWWP/MBT superfamily protein [Striga hermonthica]
MGCAGEEPFNGIDGSVGGLVWVRRRNGSWWPARIVGPDELPDGCLPAPRSGTPVKLLGREDASVDWYNLEKSKRVKAFRCEEYNDCIEKAKASTSHLSKKAVKYARREHAILHALELESACLGKDFPSLAPLKNPTEIGEPHQNMRSPLNEQNQEDFNKNSSDSWDESNSAPELSQSGVSFEEPKTCLDEIKEDCKLKKVPDNSEDEGFEGVKKRMRGLEDLGMCVGSSPGKKRPRVGRASEVLKKKNKRRTLSKVLECTPMVCVPVVCEHFSSPTEPCVVADSKIPGTKSNESNKMNNNNNSDSTITGVSCENVVSLSIMSRNNGDDSKTKENEISSVVGVVCEDGSCGRLFDVPLVTEEKQQSEEKASHWQSKGKRNSRPRRTEPDSGQPELVVPLVGPTRDTLRQIWANEFRNWSWDSGGPKSHLWAPQRPGLPVSNLKNDSSDFYDGPDLYDVNVEVRTGCARAQRVPYISLMSRLNGRPVTGHPISVEALEDGLCDVLLLSSKPKYHISSSSELDLSEFRRPRGKSRSKSKLKRNGPKNGLSSKKIRKLSSLTGCNKQSQRENKPVLEKLKGPSIACVPLKVVFSRINAALTGLARPTPPRVMGMSGT